MEITDLQSKYELRVCLKQNTYTKGDGAVKRREGFPALGLHPGETSPRARRRWSQGRLEAIPLYPCMASWGADRRSISF